MKGEKTMNNLSNEAKEAIKNCYWRKGINYVPFCAISFLPCIKVIEDGKCQTLNELDKKEGENNADI